MKFLQKPENSIAIVLIISFFLPWINVLGFVNVSAYQIPRAIEGLCKVFSALDEQPESLPSNLYLLYVLYLIPLCSCITLIGSTYKKDTRISSGIAGTVIFVVLAYALISKEVPKFEIGVLEDFGIGLWITLAASAAMLLEVLGITGKIKSILKAKKKVVQADNIEASQVSGPGQELESERICPKCGKTYDSSYKYCPICGLKLESSTKICPGTPKGEDNIQPFRNIGHVTQAIQGDTTQEANRTYPANTPSLHFSRDKLLVVVLLGIFIAVCLVAICNDHNVFQNLAQKKKIASNGSQQQTAPISNDDEYLEYETSYGTAYGIKPTDCKKAIEWLDKWPLYGASWNSKVLHTINEFVFSFILNEGGARNYYGWYAEKLDPSHFLVCYAFNFNNEEPGLVSALLFVVKDSGEVFTRTKEDDSYLYFLSVSSFPHAIMRDFPADEFIDSNDIVKVGIDRYNQFSKHVVSQEAKDYKDGQVNLSFDPPYVAASALLQMGLSPTEVVAKFGPPNDKKCADWEYDEMDRRYYKQLEYNYNGLSFCFEAESNEMISDPYFMTSKISIHTPRFAIGDIHVNSTVETALNHYKPGHADITKDKDAVYIADNDEAGLVLFHYGTQAIHKIVLWQGPRGTD